jgi:hypothetical protein
MNYITINTKQGKHDLKIIKETVRDINIGIKDFLKKYKEYGSGNIVKMKIIPNPFNYGPITMKIRADVKK